MRTDDLSTDLSKKPTCSLLKCVLKDEDRWLKYRLKLSVTAILSAILRLRKVQGLGGRATRGIWTSGSLQTLQVKTERPIMIMIKSAGQDSAPGQVTGNLLLKTRQQETGEKCRVFYRTDAVIGNRAGVRTWPQVSCIPQSVEKRQQPANNTDTLQYLQECVATRLTRIFVFFFKFKRLSPQPYP